MTGPETPRIVDQAAHEERTALDQQINAVIDRVKGTPASRDAVGHRTGLLELQELQKQRAAALRREVGMES